MLVLGTLFALPSGGGRGDRRAGGAPAPVRERAPEPPPLPVARDGTPAAPKARAARSPGGGGTRPVAAPGPGALPLPLTEAQPLAAILIDDLGQNLAHLLELAELGVPLSIAVIPGLPASSRTVSEASRLGIEVLLHQPMEPHEEGGKNPGEGVLLTSMTQEQVGERMDASLAAVPGAVGVNNHMGSLFTENPAALARLMSVLKARGLFWLDSRTTGATVGAAAGRDAGVPAIERDVFIDAERDAEVIRSQLRKLLDTARRRGRAVGIGHPRPETLAVLREMRGELLASGVSLVPVSRLVRSPQAAPSPGVSAAAPPRPRGRDVAKVGRGASP